MSTLQCCISVGRWNLLPFVTHSLHYELYSSIVSFQELDLGVQNVDIVRTSIRLGLIAALVLSCRYLSTMAPVIDLFSQTTTILLPHRDMMRE